MTTTPDPNTTWLASYFPTVIAPACEISLNALMADISYGAGIYQYDSVIGFKREMYINPISLASLLGVKKNLKWIASLASAAGNYDINISDFTDIKLGNELELLRSGFQYSANREYKGSTKGVAIALFIVLLLADLAVIMVMRFGNKEDPYYSKLTVGFAQGITSITIAGLHVLEAFGVEAVPVLTGLIIEVKQIIKLLKDLVKTNTNVADILNPLLTLKRGQALNSIADTALDKAETAISTKGSAVAALAQAIPAPNCWVARAVYGPDNPRWILFRQWLFGNGPVPEVRTLLQKLYMRYGQSFAMVVDKSPCLRSVLRLLMDLALYTHQKKAVGVDHAQS